LIDSIGSFLRSVKVRRRERSLRICETLPLGDKRFLAVVQIEGRRLLIGATNQSIAVLDRLDSNSVPRHKSEPSLGNTFFHGVH
jgi:flagellar biogenesis protein FliO